MRHDPMFYPGPLLHLLCKRKDGKKFADELASQKKAYEANEYYNEVIECQRIIFGKKFDLRVVFDIDGNSRTNHQSALIAVMAYAWSEEDTYIQIDESVDVTIDRTPETDKTFIHGGSNIEIRLPIAIPALIIDQMIGAPLGKYAENSGILGLYRKLTIKQVKTNQPTDDAFTKILLDSIGWQAQINSAWYTALAATGERI